MRQRGGGKGDTRTDDNPDRRTDGDCAGSAERYCRANGRNRGRSRSTHRDNGQGHRRDGHQHHRHDDGDLCAVVSLGRRGRGGHQSHQPLGRQEGAGRAVLVGGCGGDTQRVAALKCLGTGEPVCLGDHIPEIRRTEVLHGDGPQRLAVLDGVAIGRDAREFSARLSGDRVGREADSHARRGYCVLTPAFAVGIQVAGGNASICHREHIACRIVFIRGDNA